MPGDKHRPSVPSWKQGSAPADRKREAQPGWRKEPAPAERAGRTWSRQTKLGVGAAAFFVFSALFVWVIYWLLPLKPSALVLLGAAYEDNLSVPHNVYGWQGLKNFAALARSSAPSFLNWGGSLMNLKDKDGPRELSADTDWAKGLGDFKEDTLIVFLALHGGRDSRGPYLLRQDARGQDGRLALADVLTELSKLPAKKNKLLVLDATQASANWPQGVLHNDFARGLNDLKKQIEETKNLWVLSASGEDQQSWVSEDFHQSAFTHFLLEGLRGAADQDKSGRVSLKELSDYVAFNVKRWARTNRGALQTPVLLGDEARAASVELAKTGGGSESPTDFPAPDLAELKKEWQQCEDSRNRVPGPQVYTAHVWQEYLDTLLRYEQLVRTGCAEKTRDLQTKLGTLRAKIDSARGLTQLNSWRNSLVMPQALGLVDAARSGERQRASADELWQASPDELAKKWEQVRRGAGEGPAGDRLRLDMAGRVLGRASKGTFDDLSKANGLLTALGFDRRPAEAQFATMLAIHLDRKQPPDPSLLRLALETRIFAEQVALAVRADGDEAQGGENEYPYSEQVLPWIRGRLGEADQLRRRGEDRLFANPASRPQGRADLEKARDLYKAVKPDAEVLREAFATRDRALAELSYYSIWAARRTGGHGDRDDADKLLTDLESTWQDTYSLADQLDGSGTALQAGETVPRGLGDLAKGVRQKFQQVQDQFLRQAERIAKDPTLQTSLRDTEDSLVVPTIPVALRMKLLGNAQEISKNLRQQSSSEQLTAAEDEKAREGAAQSSRRAAESLGRMALAALGGRCFDDPALAAGHAERFAEARSRVGRLGQELQWWVSLARVSEELGARRAQLPKEVTRLVSGSRKAGLSQAANELRTAERRARALDGAAAEQVVQNPFDEARRLRTHDMLLTLAERTRLDHWWSAENPEPNAEPYYRQAALDFVQDAETLLKSGEAGATPDRDPRLAQTQAARQELNKPGWLAAELVGASAGPLEVTSEKTVSLDYRLKPAPDGWLPPGIPYVELRFDTSLKPPRDAGRVPVEIGGKQPATHPFVLERQPPREEPREPVPVTAKLELTAFFRGQKSTKPTPVRVHPLPEVVVFRQPPPPAAAIAVRADPKVHDQFAPANSAVAVVLDCSGSMADSPELQASRFDGKQYGSPDAALEAFHAPGAYSRKTPCHYHEATQQLRQVLREMPRGTTVSITVFSQRTQGISTGESNKTITVIRKPQPWDPAKLNDVMDELEELEPWNDTPLARAMKRAKDEGFPRGFRGPKTMVVLTDGMDSEFVKDAELNEDGKLNLPDFLQREFGGDERIMVNIVGFKLPPREQQTFEKQFSVVKRLPVPGNLFTVEQPEELRKRLRRYLRQELRFRVEREDGVPVDTEDGHHVTRTGAAPNWERLEPGSYRLLVQTNRVLREERFALGRGDCLLVNLSADDSGRGFRFERALAGEEYDPVQKWPPVQDAVATALQDEAKADGSLEMLVSLENTANRGKLEQIRPKTAWFELQPQEPRPVAVRWGEALAYAAPAWDLRVPLWPARGPEPVRPQIKAWWNYQNELSPVRREPRAGAALGSMFSGMEVQVGTDAAHKAVVEDFGVEELDVETRPGSRKTERVSCLVVRLRYDPPDNLVWVDIDGPRIGGYEHRFYTRAHKYTGVFWPVQKDVAERVRALRFYSLSKLKSDSESGTVRDVELNFKDPPNPNAARPSPVPLREAEFTRPPRGGSGAR